MTRVEYIRTTSVLPHNWVWIGEQLGLIWWCDNMSIVARDFTLKDDGGLWLSTHVVQQCALSLMWLLCLCNPITFHAQIVWCTMFRLSTANQTKWLHNESSRPGEPFTHCYHDHSNGVYLKWPVSYIMVYSTMHGIAITLAKHAMLIRPFIKLEVCNISMFEGNCHVEYTTGFALSHTSLQQAQTMVPHTAPGDVVIRQAESVLPCVVTKTSLLWLCTLWLSQYRLPWLPQEYS